jgi:prevent-host-death family protein
VAERTIPQRELRNNVSAVLSAAEAGESFTVTVRGRAVARVVPLGDADQRRVDVDRATIRRILSLPVDEGFASDVDAAEAPVDAE